MIFYILLESRSPLSPSISQAEAAHRTRSKRMIPTPTQTPTPTLRPIRTPTPTLKPIKTPTLIPTKVPTIQATPSLTMTSSLSFQDFIMSEINEYRRSQGLSIVKTHSSTCAFAKTRAKEIATSFNHDGFRDRINNKTLPYPSYSSITENIAMTSDYKQVVTMWKNSSGHAENMRKDTPFVCVEREGNYYAYEGWKP